MGRVSPPARKASERASERREARKGGHATVIPAKCHGAPRRTEKTTSGPVSSPRCDATRREGKRQQERERQRRTTRRRNRKERRENRASRGGRVAREESGSVGEAASERRRQGKEAKREETRRTYWLGYASGVRSNDARARPPACRGASFARS